MEPQLSLPLDIDAMNEDALRLAWIRSGLPVPFHLTLSSRALAICLRGLADAMQQGACMPTAARGEPYLQA
jgi:hypothetical protein